MMIHVHVMMYMYLYTYIVPCVAFSTYPPTQTGSVRAAHSETEVSGPAHLCSQTAERSMHYPCHMYIPVLLIHIHVHVRVVVCNRALYVLYIIFTCTCIYMYAPQVCSMCTCMSSLFLPYSSVLLSHCII